MDFTKLIEENKADNNEKKKMSVALIKYDIKYDDHVYSLSIKPKGKGYYDVKCIKTHNHNIFNQTHLRMDDYFCHSISMSRAKDMVLEFHKHLIEKNGQ